MTENKYKITINACFLAYIVQAVVNNFVPLLFVTFQREFDIPLSKITLLITFNFLLHFVEKGRRSSHRRPFEKYSVFYLRL